MSGRLNFLGHFFYGDAIKIPANEAVFREPVLMLVPCEFALQCWDTTAEGPRGPPCAGSAKCRGFARSNRNPAEMSVQCLFPRFLPFPEELVAFFPRLMQHFPEVTIYSPSRRSAWSLTQWCLEILLSGLDNSCPAGLCPVFPCCLGERTGISPEMVFHFPAAHWKFLGPAQRGHAVQP